MSEKNHQLEKEKFQLDRVALFSDAVFAICITLLVIEIKLPEISTEEITESSLLNMLLYTTPKFIGFFVSFFVIGLYWLAHYRLFRYITYCSQKLIWRNLLFLFSIVLMPFSTALLSEYYIDNLRTPLLFYTVNICLSGSFSFHLWTMAYKGNGTISEGLTKGVYRYNSTRAVTTPGFFLLASLISFASVSLAYKLLPVMFLITLALRRYFFKKYPQELSAE